MKLWEKNKILKLNEKYKERVEAIIDYKEKECYLSCIIIMEKIPHNERCFRACKNLLGMLLDE
jgi:hypothetical protein